MNRDAVIVEFIGGPLDGPHPTFPEMNWILKVDGHPEGVYQFGAGAYWWVAVQPNLVLLPEHVKPGQPELKRGLKNMLALLCRRLMAAAKRCGLSAV